MARVEIVDGPNLMNLMLAHYDSLPDGKSRRVVFTVKPQCGCDDDSLTLKANIFGSDRHIADREFWSLRGEVFVPKDDWWAPFTADYSTSSRNGWLECSRVSCSLL